VPRVGYHCSHEQHPPSALLEHVRAAERAGFAAAMCSDHLMPWLPDQGHSGFTWSWLGPALQSTQLSLGTVTAPGQRYHPVMTAHAIATLAEMYPTRLWVALGSGEALNEHVTDDPWPDKPARRARLRECVDIMRALFSGETVTHRGHVRVRDAKLYTRPAEMPQLFGAALTVETARWAADWADGLITIASEPAKLRPIIDAFRERSTKPVYVQAAIAYAASEREAEEQAMAWRHAAVGNSDTKADLETPEQFAVRCEKMSIAQLRSAVRISASRQQHVDWIAGDFEVGADQVFVHHVGPSSDLQHMFLRDLAPDLLRL
jgi:probable non-F420 flavinoid oxidoreductase